MLNNKNTTATAAFTGTLAAGVSVLLSVGFYTFSLYRKKRASHWQEIEEEVYGNEEIPSIISHFKTLTLDPNTTVEEANKRRTVSYYEKAREAHQQNFVKGIWFYNELISKRKQEQKRIMYYWNTFKGSKSHRTVIVMCDKTTSTILYEARTNILKSLNHSTNMSTEGVWIPNINIIPEDDMHITVAIPWWWHSIRGDAKSNYELSKALASRFRQTLYINFHHPFQIELERIVLLGGKTLVALWRCVGVRTNSDDFVIYDRHGETTDPFVTLRREIVQCFTTEDPDIKRQPLTYAHNKKKMQRNEEKIKPKIPKPNALIDRQNTIESKTPGLLSSDGFIHTTLARLPLDCLSSHDIELEDIHRLCREATATYCGHRMVISKFRFLETTGKGGESNPCVGPIYDETIEAPSRLEKTCSGTVYATDNLHVHHQSQQQQNYTENCSTIGALPSDNTDPRTTATNDARRDTVIGLFDKNIPDALPEEIEETTS